MFVPDPGRVSLCGRAAPPVGASSVPACSAPGCAGSHGTRTGGSTACTPGTHYNTSLKQGRS